MNFFNPDLSIYNKSYKLLQELIKSIIRLRIDDCDQPTCFSDSSRTQKKTNEYHDKLTFIDYEYFDIAELVKQYNIFLQNYEMVLNQLQQQYQSTYNKIVSEHSNNSEVNEWINQIVGKMRDNNITFSPIKVSLYHPQKTILPICDELFDLIETMTNDIEKNYNFLRYATENLLKLQTIYESTKEIFSK